MSLRGFPGQIQFLPPITINFTWTISTESDEFLDIRIYKGSRFRDTGFLDVQTHFKATNTFQYLHFSSSHPKGVFKGLAKGRAIQFLRSNSTRKKQSEGTHTFLLTHSPYLLETTTSNLFLPLTSTSPLALISHLQLNLL